MRVIVTGSRGWKDWDIIRGALLEFQREAALAGEELVVVHGHNPKGADHMADAICHTEKIEKIRVRANWQRYKAGAGPRRNAEMLAEYGPIDYTLAFRAGGKSSGTDDMISKSLRADVPVYLYREGSFVGTRVTEQRKTYDAAHA